MKVLILCIFILALIEGVRSGAEAKGRLRQARENKIYYDAYSELIMSVRERQHDLDNHISAILGMIYTIDNYEELARRQREYCHELMDRSEQARLLLSVPHRLIAGFLSLKTKEALQHNIRVEYLVTAGEAKTELMEYELIEILGILFDNALHALKGQTWPGRCIYLEVIDQDGKLVISLANTSRVLTPDEILLFFRRKETEGREGHGIGLKKLKKIVHGMGGEIIVSNERIGGENCLRFDIEIPDNESP